MTPVEEHYLKALADAARSAIQQLCLLVRDDDVSPEVRSRATKELVRISSWIILPTEDPET